MIRTGTKNTEEVDGAKEISPVETTAIAVTVAETQQLQNKYLKGK